jgi:uracil-DNA glycosylase
MALLLHMTQEASSAAQFVPHGASLSKLEEAAKSCTGCALYKNATQTVFGEGQRSAQIVFVGEQPGDREDIAGKPFVGPAGKLLDQALADVGLPRDAAYVTNAVKHFKWELRGKRRIHKKPSQRELEACWPWLEAELQLIQPEVIVCLGLSAARSVAQKIVRLKDVRARFFENSLGIQTFVTVHPSSLLRLRTRQEREAEYRRFVSDLRQVRDRISQFAQTREDLK